MFDAIAKMFADIAMKTAISACSAASNWNAYQPKEPAILKDMSK